MKTCWAVSSGDYSDYNVWCVFTTKELADAYVAAWNEAWRESQRAAGKDVSDTGHPYDAPGVETFQLWDSLPIVKPTVDRGPYGEPVDDGLGDRRAE